MTVVETPEFQKATQPLMPEAERMRLIDHLAHNPQSGDVIPGAGGVRKLRWALAGRGKSGGARAIYFYHDPGMPLFALTAYAKSGRADLGQADRNALKRLTAALVAAHKGKK